MILLKMNIINIMNTINMSTINNKNESFLLFINNI